MNKKLYKIFLPLLILALGIGTFASLRATAPVVKPKPSREKVWPVETIELFVDDIRPEILEYGTIVAGNQADLRPLVPGRIVKVGSNYFEGAIIKSGETLAVIDPFDYRIEVADRKAALTEALTKDEETRSEIKSEVRLLEISRSQLNLRKRDFDRRKKLVKQGLKIFTLAHIFFRPRVTHQHKIKVKIKTDNLETEMVMDRMETLETETVEMETLETVVMVETQAVKVT